MQLLLLLSTQMDAAHIQLGERLQNSILTKLSKLNSTKAYTFEILEVKKQFQFQI